MDFVAVAIDNNGHTHVATSNYTGIHYFTDRTGPWLRTDLTETPERGADIEPAIAVDSSGTVAIAFTRWSTWQYCDDVCEDPVAPVLEGVFFMTHSLEHWSSPERVPQVGQRPTIAFDPRGLHVVTEVQPTESSGELSWSTLPQPYASTAEWSTSNIAAEGRTAEPHLVVDRNSAARLLYKSPLGIELTAVSPSDEFAVLPLEAWDAELPLVAFDRTNRPHLVYGIYDSIADESFAIHTVLRDDGTWEGPAPLGFPSASAFAVDDRDVLHVAYMAFVEEKDADDEYRLFEEVWYASAGGGTTTTIRLDRSDSYELGSMGLTVMALDATDRPRLVYSAHGQGGEGTGVYYALGPAAGDG